MKGLLRAFPGSILVDKSTRAHAVGLVNEYLARTGMSGWALGTAAVGSTKAFTRLRQGANIELRTVEALEEFMATHPEGVHVPRPGARKPAATVI